MKPAFGADRDRIGRRSYAIVTLVYVLFIVYGSLIPLEFQPLPLEAALERFSTIFVLPMRVDSRADVLTNFLLLIPLGYFLLAALRTDRRDSAGQVAAALLTLAFCMTLSVAVEFAQLFCRGRTVALSDIVAQCAGAITGVVLWLSTGEVLTAWARSIASEHDRPETIQQLLLVYCVGLFISQVLPLNLTLSLGELAHKYRNGRIIVVPFGYSYSSWFTMAWDFLEDIAMNAPLGAAAALLWSPAGSRRRPRIAFAAGVAAVAAIEFSQLFVYSRTADVTDILTGAIGVALGVAAVTALSDRREAAPMRGQAAGRVAAPLARIARIGTVVWAGVLVSYHWNPFDFTVAHHRVVLGLHQLLSVPFSSYYAGTSLHALTEMVHKILLALPLGVLLRLSWPERRRSAIPPRLRLVMLAGLALCVLVAIEVGQVFLPTRVPDLTDAMAGELGVVVGLWLAGLLAGPQQDRAVAVRPPLGVPLRPSKTNQDVTRQPAARNPGRGVRGNVG